jgi:hypothetical protein
LNLFYLELNRVGVIDDFEGVKWQILSSVRFGCSSREHLREFLMVECRLARSFFGIDNDKFLSLAKVIAVPKSRTIIEPMSLDFLLEHEVLEIRFELVGSLVISLSDTGLRDSRRYHKQKTEDRKQRTEDRF